MKENYLLSVMKLGFALAAGSIALISLQACGDDSPPQTKVVLLKESNQNFLKLQEDKSSSQKQILQPKHQISLAVQGVSNSNISFEFYKKQCAACHGMRCEGEEAGSLKNISKRLDAETTAGILRNETHSKFTESMTQEEMNHFIEWLMKIR